jgi:hypothetical protein
MNQALVQITIALALAPVAVAGNQLRLCVENQAEVSLPARAELLLELVRLLPGAALAEPSLCALEADAIRISLIQSAAHHPADALGAIQVEQGRIAPPALVFVDAVARHSGATGEGALGRALARVAAHELLHFLRQTEQHSHDGLLQEKLTAQELTRNPGPPAWTMRARTRSASR